VIEAIAWLGAAAAALAIFAAIVRHNDRRAEPWPPGHPLPELIHELQPLVEHVAGEHDVIRHQACALCHDQDPPPGEVVVGRMRWDPSAGPIVRATGRPAGGLVYDPEPPDESGDWIQVETAGGLIWRRVSHRLAGIPDR